ncbi:MAG: adenosylmethionine decarboxylase [Gammaproteobacteria bacterium]|nr:adenosylmethionine decarboxylase [Gammaproteobacteria bacterium]
MSTVSPSRSTVPFAGRHLLIECFGAHANLDANALETLLKDSAMAGGATVLSCHLHGFGKGGGVTGVALLAESHITVHTWPERGYAAFDVFMCGNCEAMRAAKVIEEAVPGAVVDIQTVNRPSPGVQS